MTDDHEENCDSRSDTSDGSATQVAEESEHDFHHGDGALPVSEFAERWNELNDPDSDLSDEEQFAIWIDAVHEFEEPQRPLSAVKMFYAEPSDPRLTFVPTWEPHPQWSLSTKEKIIDYENRTRAYRKSLVHGLIMKCLEDQASQGTLTRMNIRRNPDDHTYQVFYRHEGLGGNDRFATINTFPEQGPRYESCSHVALIVTDMKEDRESHTPLIVTVGVPGENTAIQTSYIAKLRNLINTQGPSESPDIIQAAITLAYEAEEWAGPVSTFRLKGPAEEGSTKPLQFFIGYPQTTDIILIDADDDSSPPRSDHTSVLVANVDEQATKGERVQLVLDAFTELFASQTDEKVLDMVSVERDLRTDSHKVSYRYKGTAKTEEYWGKTPNAAGASRL